MKQSFTVFIILCFSVFAGIFVLKTDCEPAETHNCSSCKLIQQFGLAVEKIKEVCTKDPQGKINTLLQNGQLLNTNIDTNSIVCIGKHLEKDTEIKQAAEKITKKLNKKMKLIEKCFVNKDPKSFPKFEKLLRNTTLKCGGLSFLWGKRETYQAAAFVAAAKCLECHSPSGQASNTGP